MSWNKVKLKEVLKQYRVQHIVQDDVEYKQVTISKYDGVTFRGTKIGKEIGRKRQFVIDLKTYPNTLMLVRQGIQDGSIGIAPIEVDGCIATENMPMFSIEGIDLEYLRFLLKSPYFYDELNKIETTGSAQKSIHERQILEIKIPLPNLEEQKQFVKELTKLKNGGIEISSELNHQLDLIKQLRQSFLREAMQGKLCQAEPVEAQETGQQLLSKIKAEKAKLIAQKILKKEKELTPITKEEIPFAIPKHWAWCKIDKLVTSLNKDIRTGPFGTALQKYEHKKEGIPVWGIESISKDGKFTNINKIYISDLKAKELKSFEVKGRDLIISRSGTIGELCMLPIDIEYGLISTNLMKISVDQKVIMPEYFCNIIKGGGYITKMLQEFCSGSTRLFITQKILCKLIFPLPPLHEQQQIVAKLEELMSFCDGLEQSIKESQGYNEMLLQQVLREALQGEGI